MLTRRELEDLIDYARGIKPCDIVLQGGKYLNVFTGEWITGDIAIAEGRVVGVGDDYQAEKKVNVKGKYLVPGFIDSHVHIESTCMVPDQFQRVALVRGTTGAIVDPHEIANVMGIRGIQYFLDCAEKSTMNIYVMLSSCVPATSHLETSGAKLSAEDLVKLKDHPHALGLAELMNFPGLLFKDKEVLDKVMAFQDRPIDGHCPMLRGKDLNAYAAAGIGSCHESVTLPEAQEKLEKGIHVELREGSVAKNVKDLCKILDAYSSPKISLCTDDRNPVDILDEGHVDYLIKLCIKKGIPPEVVYRSASWSTARHYGLKRRGAISPGYFADIVVLKDYKNVTIDCVYKDGVPYKKLEEVPSVPVSPPTENTVKYNVPVVGDLKIQSGDGNYRIIEVIPNQIITNALEQKIIASDQEIKPDIKKDILKIAVLERHGKGLPMAKALVTGFGLKKGALGSSVAHDSHNIVVVGTNDEDMIACFKWMLETGGGFVAIDRNTVKASLPLPVAGLMTEAPLKDVYKNLKNLRSTAKSFGCKLEEPFLQMAFLCLPVIPTLKITDRGLVDVAKFDFVSLKI
jgi:adenine deaminase